MTVYSDQPIITFLGPAIHWGVIEADDGTLIGGQFWSVWTPLLAFTLYPHLISFIYILL
jgi:hypothetical protein